MVHRADGFLRHGLESKVALAFVAVESIVTAFKRTSFTNPAKFNRAAPEVARRGKFTPETASKQPISRPRTT